MRSVVLVLAVLALAACATGRVEPVPETGAFSMKYMELDGDYFLQVEKIGATQAATVSNSAHPVRTKWTGRRWLAYGDRLFPSDEIDFDELRRLRGSNLIPAGLVSPTPTAVPPCETTSWPHYAKVQTRTIRRAPRRQPLARVTMVTECWLHEGLSPSQYAGIHQRPNPYRFPTRYETVVDLDRDGRVEQRNVRIRNVPKSRIEDFLRDETILSAKVRRAFENTLDRM